MVIICVGMMSSVLWYSKDLWWQNKDINWTKIQSETSLNPNWSSFEVISPCSEANPCIFIESVSSKFNLLITTIRTLEIIKNKINFNIEMLF